MFLKYFLKVLDKVRVRVRRVWWFSGFFIVSNQLQERSPVDRFSSAVPQLHGRLDPISYGSYLDAAIPFPRTSGAKFCACGE